MTTRRRLLITAGRLGLGAAGVGAVVSRSRESAAAGARRTVHREAREAKWKLIAHKPGSSTATSRYT